VERADELGLALHRALKVAHDPPCGPVFLAFPIDVLEQETDQAALPPGRLYREPAPDPAGVAAALELLLAARSPAIVAGDDVTRSGAQDDLVALAEASGAGVWVEGLRQQVVFPTAHPCFRGALPFDAVAIRQALTGADLVLLAGGPFFEEVWWAPGPPLPAEARVVHLEASPERLARNFRVDVGLLGGIRPGLATLRREIESRATAGFREAAARRLQALSAQRAQDQAAQASRAQRRWDRVPVSMPRLMAEVRQALPPEAIVVDEAITASLDLARTLTFRAPGDYYSGRGGGIGQALPGALGVKLAHPGRPVLAISGDGSAMYSLQALWSAAHHGLAIVFLILDNGEYRILKHNLDTYRQRFGAKPEGPYPHMDLGSPALGWCDIARGLGVAATRVERPEAVAPALRSALASGRPHLLDVAVEGRG
jgi:benzoylformate decarboxylase